ncbi:hypothetical protein M434DRAFT_26350 [Hypoxylon sp. CO27-5]|nr:hypothetical protein M434DRAFT_26350 [Hypoxylon sp. CO27-5]
MDSGGANRNNVASAKFDKSELLNALDSIYPASSFSGFAPVQCHDPDIFVQDVGRIDLPLSETQAKELALKSHQAPYGKGSETIVDTSVRNTWELNPDQFEIRAPDWSKVLDAVLAYVRKKLAIRPLISAELYKMLLYEEGAMFKAHTDTEKVPRMFGTLVISLPSSHEGGDVIVTHQGYSQRYETSRHDMACAFWFSDVSHEVLPVKRGYRWVLTYNLAIEQSAHVPTADGFVDHQEIRRVLQSWLQEVNTGSRKASPLYFVLNHKYTEANISYEGLKPPDLDVVESLREVCPELGFDLFLTTLERKESGLPQDGRFDPYYRDRYDRYDESEEDDCGIRPLEEVYDVSYCSKYVFDLNGNKLVSYVPLNSDNILHEDPFEDGPDQEDYEGYMGNSGPSATHWYRLSAVIIIPCRGTVSFLSSTDPDYLIPNYPSNDDFQALCTYFTTQCVEASERATAQLYEFVRTTCYPSLSPPKAQRLAGGDLLKVLQASILAPKPELLDFILSKSKAQVPIDFFAWIKGKHDNSRISTEKFKRGFLHALRTQATLSEQYQAILAVEGEMDPTDEIHDIISRAVNECIHSYPIYRPLFEEDGPALFDLSLYYHDFSYLEEIVLPIVEARRKSTAFVLGFIRALYQSMKRQQISQDRAQPMYEYAARLALQGIKLASLAISDIPLSQKVQETERTGLTKQYMTYDSMLKFVSTLVALKLETHLELLAAKLHSEAEQINEQAFKELWIPLFQTLLPILAQQKINLLAGHWIQMFQTLLKAYLKNYVRDKPLKTNMSREKVSCYCADCKMDLNPFLASSNRIGRFRMGEKRRRHLETKLYQAHIDCTAHTERSGIPYTLVVTKTTRLYDAALDTWWWRRNLAEDQLETFDQDLLRSVLDNQFDEIMSMKFLERQEQPTMFGNSLSSSSRHPPIQRPSALNNSADQLRELNAEIARLAGPSSTTPNPSSTPKPSSSTPSRPSQMIPNPIAGTKRKYIEVIDLTGDD